MWMRPREIWHVLPVLCMISAEPSQRAIRSGHLRSSHQSADSLVASRGSRAVSAALSRLGVNSGVRVTLWRYRLCMSNSLQECAPTISDTIEAPIRFPLRRQLGRCPDPSAASAAIVQLSRERLRGDTATFLVGISADQQTSSELRDDWIFLARISVKPEGAEPVAVSLVQQYHSTSSRGMIEPNVLLDDTCK